ncbi:MAG TPA: gamma-glutamyl-gamma-aminobutyrate hydrolase family protein [Pseudonocardia sp.]
MADGRRPVVAVPMRFSRSASALRFEAVVVARRLAQAVWDAGGDPVGLFPHAPDAVVDVDAARERLRGADGVLLPGGGDVAARWTGRPPHPSLYDVDEEQDAFDLAVARAALEDGVPLLAICRGTQVVNVARGGDLVQDMDETVGAHRGRVHEIAVVPDSPLGAIVGSRATISCAHHQCIDRLGEGLKAAAHSADGVIEAVTLDDHPGWYLGVQWHPEDTAATDPVQAALFRRFVRASAGLPLNA